MTHILELSEPLAKVEKLTAECELRPGVSPEAVLSHLPAGVSQALQGMMGATSALHQGLLVDQALTGIRRLRLYAWHHSAASLAAGSESGGYTAQVAIPALAAGAAWASCLAALLRSQALYPGPQDSRLPPRFSSLARAVAPLRHVLEKIRWETLQDPRLANELLAPLQGEETSKLLDPRGQTHQLLSRFLSRQDWRERDVLYLILDFIQESPRLFGEELMTAVYSLKRLQNQDPVSAGKVLAALINEGRGYLGELPRWRAICREAGLHCRQLGNTLDVALIGQAVADLLGVQGLAEEPVPTSVQAEGYQWPSLRAAMQQKWGEVQPILKPLEKASLFLAAEFFPETASQRRLCRYLLENEAPYRQMLAAYYSSPEVRQAQAQRLLADFNRQPVNQEAQVSMTETEMKQFVQVFFLRPEPVEAIVDRERRKELYQILPGLSPRAWLPQVLHECQRVFGWLTPEVVSRVSQELKVKPADVIQLIASYKDYSADPAGRLVMYVCKGTACFLRGQPHLSRSLATHLDTTEGRVSPSGVQYLERDCFGVCHLAPVIKVGQNFIGQVKAAEVPQLVERLLRGRSYENRTDFFKAVKEVLAEEDEIVFRHTFRLRAAHQLDVSLDSGVAAGERQVGLAINGLGEIRLWPEQRPLGVLVEHSYSFIYTDRRGMRQVGTLVVDEGDDLMGMVNIADQELQEKLRCTLRPRVALKDGQVFLSGWPVPLGEYHSSTVVVRKPDNTYGSLVFAEDNLKAPPEDWRLLPEKTRLPAPPEFYRRQDRHLLGFVEGVNPDCIDSYLEKGGYQALKKVLGYGQAEKRWDPEAIIQEVTLAHLRGRGGAGFPTGVKWRAMLKAQPEVRPQDEVQAAVKLLVANGDEGDPGAFMDRTLIQERPHQLLEGMLIAALATGCRFGIIYVRREYEDAVQRLENAVFEARRYGFLGRRVMGVDFDFDVEIRLGAGAFVAGEKRAIMRAIEGKAAEPDLKAVSNVKRGLWGKPTLLNNVETLANIPLIIREGGGWFRDLGYGTSGGTKLFSVAGVVNQTGLIEVKFGRTLRDILNIAGGVQDGKTLAGVQIGGPSGAILALTGIREYLLDTPLAFDTFEQVGAMIGSGGLVFLGEDDDVVRLAHHFIHWLSEESCGQCPACMNGLLSLRATLDRLLKGEATFLDIHLLWGKADLIRAGSHCGLGQTAPNPVTSSLRFFPVAYLHYLLDNPGMETQGLFLSLEALRLITREEPLPGTIAFTLKKGMIKFIWQELEKRDRWRPGMASRSGQFLRLLNLSAAEVGRQGVKREYTRENLGQTPDLMVGNAYGVSCEP